MAGTRRAHRDSILESVFGSSRDLRAAEVELRNMLTARGIAFGDGLLPTYAFALVMAKERVDEWARKAELVIGAANYLSQQAMDEALTADTQAFDMHVNELIFAYPGYDRCCVLTRPDGVPMGDDVKFVELNCDSPAMMMFLDIVTDCVLQLDAFARLRQLVRPMSAADRLLQTLLECYREYGGTDTPTIAITDWAGQKTRFEHQRLAEHFEARGYPTIVCDPRSFRRVDGHLCSEDGRRIHLVYRRALVAEIIARREQIQPLLQSYVEGDICMVNPLRAYVASAKSLMTKFDREELPEEFAAAADLVPRTVMLNNRRAREMVMGDRDRWVLKKSESHGGKNVILPGVSTESAWNEALENSHNEVWIAQSYLDVPRLRFPAAKEETIAWEEKYFNWNPFVFGGQYAGGLVRTSATPLINITLGGGLMPTLCK